MQQKIQKYHISMRIMHWIMALMIIYDLSVGFFATSLASLSGYTIKQLFWLHKSFGVLIIALLFIRIILRFTTKIPELPKTIKPYEKTLSSIVHFLMYVSMLLIPISGIILVNSHGHAVPFFNIDLPMLFSENKELSKNSAQIHKFIAFGIIFFILAHLAGAIKHRLFDSKESNILKRML